MTRHIHLALSLCLLTACICQQPQPTLAQTPAAPPQSQSSANSLNDLLNRLDSPQFAVRQAASAELLKLDESQLDAFQNARKALSGESAQRAARVFETVANRWFKQHLLSLENNADTTRAAAFVDWLRFQSLVQDDATALELFPQLVRSEQALFLARQYQPETLPTLLESQAHVFATSCNGREDQPFPVTSAMALMLIASDPEVRLLRATSTSISSCLDDPRFHVLVEHGVHAPLIRNLLSSWIQRPGISPDRPLIFATQHKLSSARPVAIRVLQSQPRGPRGFHALMCLAALNNAEDLPLIESLLESPASVWPPKGAPADPGPDKRPLPSTYQVQLGDVALLAALHLRNAVSSMPELHPVHSDITLYRLDSLGFDSEDQRNQARTAYKNRFPSTPASGSDNVRQSPP